MAVHYDLRGVFARSSPAFSYDHMTGAYQHAYRTRERKLLELQLLPILTVGALYVENPPVSLMQTD